MSVKKTAFVPLFALLLLVAVIMMAVSASGQALRRKAQRKYPSAPLFAAAVDYESGGQNATGVAVGDVNGDGNADLVLANDCFNSTDCANGSVGVLLGNGDGTFKAPVSYNTGGYRATSVAIADVNGDGHLDLIVTQCANAIICNGVVGVLLGKGDGTFENAVIYGTGGYTATSVVVEDVNGDTKPDLLVANQCTSVYDCSTGSVGVLLGNGNGTFRAATSYNTGGQYADSIAAADLNNDHKIDVVVAHECAGVANCANGVLGVLLGNGDGTFQNPVIYGSGGQYSYAVTTGDVNGDGKPDLLATNRCTPTNCAGDGNVAVLLGNGNGTFRTAVAYDSGGQSPSSVTAVDVNGDSKLDLEVANNCANSTCFNGAVGVLLGNGDGTFQPALTYNSGGFTGDSIVAQDVNGDGKPDLVVANVCASFTDCSHGVVGVLLGIQEGTITVVTTSMSPSYVGQPVTFTATITSGGGQIPNGEIVSFDDAGTQIGTAPTMNGVAKFTTSSLLQGKQSVKATYPGDAFFQSSYGAVTQDVVQYPTTTTLISNLNPSTYGQSVQLTATVQSSAPGGATGTVTFKTATQNLGTQNLSSGKATLTVATLPAGQLTLTAIYNGDTQSAQSSGTANQTVKQATTSTSLMSAPNPSKSGRLVKFTATVTSLTTMPTGSVTFKDGTNTLGTTYLTNGTTTYGNSNLSVGTHNITAVYNGNSNVAGSKSQVLVQTVQP